MRLPSFDVSLLAVHYLLSAAHGDPAPDSTAARTSRRPPPLGKGEARHRSAPLPAVLPSAFPDVVARAARAGLLPPSSVDWRDDGGAWPSSGRTRGSPHRAPRTARRPRALPRGTPATDPPPSPVPPTGLATRTTASGTRALPPAANASGASAATATVPAAWADLWTTLPVYQRADLARAAARAQRTGASLEESLRAVEEENDALAQRWLTAPRDDPAGDADAAFARHEPHARHTDAIDLDRMLRTGTGHGLQDAMRAADRLARRPSSGPPTAEQEAAYQAGRLADLFATERLCDAHSDLALLRAVHAGLRARFPGHHAPLLDDRAIAIASRLRQRCENRRDDDATASRMRFFLKEVTSEYEAETFATRLIPRRAAPTAQRGPWFDGIAIRNAVGKNVTDLTTDLIRFEPGLAHDLAMQAGPTCSAVVPARPWSTLTIATSRCHRLLEIWMRKRVNDLLESVRFPFGTPPQSIDTVLLRLSRAHGVALSTGDDFATILRDFNRLCAAWRAAPAYWISPTLAAALHFAHASENQAALLAASAPERENLAIDFFHESLAAYAGSAPQPVPDSSQSAVAREIVESLLVLPRWPMSVGKTLIRGQPREILSLLPFVVPAYDIEEGIRHGNDTRALRGAFQFGADLLLTWIGGRVEASLAAPDALPLVEHGERAMLGMLHRGLETLGETRGVSLPLIERTAAEPVGTVALRADADIPLRYRLLASRARGGEVVPVQLPNIPHAGLVHLAREDRVIPVGLSGNVIWELDWNGHVVAPLGDTRLGAHRPRILAGLRQAAAPAGLAGSVDAAAIADGPTVRSVLRWLDTHAATSLPRGANSNAYAETVLNRLTAVVNEDSEEWRIYQELGMAHMQSETFRLLTNRATPRLDNRALRFDVRPGAVPGYAPAEHVITLPPASELAEIEYLGATGAVQFDPRDVWIHEFVHAMTLLTDPPPSLAAHHRGPVVYLTDRILYEINRPTPERVAYAMPVTRTGSPATINLVPLAERTMRENLLLDAHLARRMPLAADTLVCGTPVAQRTTVLAAKRIEAAVRAPLADPAPDAPFLDRLIERLLESNFALDGRSPAHLRLLRHFTEHARFLYHDNAWARHFLDAWLARDTTTRWTLDWLSGPLAEQVGAPCRVDTDAHRIEISVAPSFAYLSPTGLKPYTMQRRVATMLAELGLPARARTPGIDPETERGAVVYVEDKLLGLAADSEDRRICARIWRVAPTDPPSAQPPVNPTLARRAADDEDRFLAWACTPQSDHTCVCS